MSFPPLTSSPRNRHWRFRLQKQFKNVSLFAPRAWCRRVVFRTPVTWEFWLSCCRERAETSQELSEECNRTGSAIGQGVFGFLMRFSRVSAAVLQSTNTEIQWNISPLSFFLKDHVTQFLALRCFKISSRSATITVMWIDHLFERTSLVISQKTYQFLLFSKKLMI